MSIAPRLSHDGRVGLMQPGITCLNMSIATHPGHSTAPYGTPPRLLRLHLADAVFHDECLTVGVADRLLNGMQVAGVEDESNHICR